MDTAHAGAASPIRAPCYATGLTLPQIADELGVSLSNARSMSCGRLPASDRVLRKIALPFDVDLSRQFTDRAQAHDATFRRNAVEISLRGGPHDQAGGC